ncbi:uncharacterized protein PG986_005044 [Apiospora aurea]|uniref:Uncharacterized protein n=1 Tax=Apiospora aurea TaxID=335848 RepID=A0ABR1QGF8_9PEZI
MDPQTYRRLMEEIRALRNEKTGLQLSQIGLQRRLDRQSSSAQQLRGQLQEQSQENKRLRGQLEEQCRETKQLRDELDRQGAAQSALQKQLHEQEASNAEPQTQVIDQEICREEIQGRLDKAKEQMNEAVDRAEDFEAHYKASMIHTRNMVAHANEAAARANEKHRIAQEMQDYVDSVEEESHRLYSDWQDAKVEASQLDQEAEGLYQYNLALLAERESISELPRSTSTGVSETRITDWCIIKTR